MVNVVTEVDLPVDEKLRIYKNRLIPAAGLKGDEKRISVVTGTHGDELEGQYVCYELQRRIKEHMDNLTGIVDIYPAINPLGIDSITRGVPGFDLDMNRIFPGNTYSGAMPEYLAAGIVKDLTGSDMCVDIHASNIFLKEIPQVRINEKDRRKLVPYARLLNIDYIWVHSAATVLESTLAYSLNSTGTPMLVVEQGVGMRLTREYGDQLVDGIFVLMKKLGIWNGKVIKPKKPIVSKDGMVSFINAPESGIFVPEVAHSNRIKKGELVGNIIDPLNGEILNSILSPVDGLVFTLREYPVVNRGSLIARILEM